MWKGTNGHECKEVGKCHYHLQSGHQNSWELGGEKVRGGVGERSLYWRKTRAVGGQRDPQGERQGELLGRGGWGGGTGEGAGDDS